MVKAWAVAIVFGLLVLLITLGTSAAAPHIDSSARITVYYNGTVVAELRGVTQFRLFGTNVTSLSVVGSPYYIKGNTVYFNNASYVWVAYHASFSNGVVNVTEPYNFTLVVYLPYTYSIVYASPGPTSVSSSGNLYSVTFKGSSVLVTFVSNSGSSHAPSAPPQANPTQNQGLIGLLLAGLLVTNTALITIVVLLVRALRRREGATVQARTEVDAQVAQGIQEEGVESEPDTEDAVLDDSVLNERDKQVLDAIKSGANSLADIVKVTGLPKTTAYRRVKKLVRLGLVKEVREKGKVRYEVQDKGQTNNP